jgi:ABC-type transport system involved in multi-copper enzyme maturation permease subunit
MWLSQTSIELRKTIKHPALWAGLAALLFLLTVYIAVLFSQIKYGFTSPVGGANQDLLSALSIFNWIGGFVYAVTASVIMAYDYPNLRLYLSRGLPRCTLLLARWFVILLMSALLIGFAIYAALGLAAVMRPLFLSSADVPHLTTVTVLPAILRTFLSSLPYLGLTILLAVISRSAIFAAGGMIIYADVFEKYLLSLGDRYPLLTRYLPGQLSLILQAKNFTVNPAAPRLAISPDLMSEPQAILAIGMIFIVLCSLSFVIFSRQDLGG